MLCPLVLAVGLVAGAATAGQASQPSQEQIQITDSALPPATLEEMWQEADIVAVVRIRTALLKEIQSSPSHPTRLLTEHRAVVSELLKTKEPLEVSDEMSISVAVGTKTLADGQTVKAIAAGVRAFLPGEVLLVFLKRWPFAGGYGLAYGQAGYYQFDHPQIALPVEVSQWPTFAGRRSVSRAEFMAALRRLKSLE